MSSCAFFLQIQAIVVFSLLTRCASATPTRNITIEVPDGTSSHGDPHLLCTPATALTILIFFAGNFLAHAATVKAYPGEERLETVISIIIAVLFPTSGIVRGLNAFARRGMFTSSSLQRAARSGALCMVIRNQDWEPEDGAEIAGFEIAPESKLDDIGNDETLEIDGELYISNFKVLNPAFRAMLRSNPIFQPIFHKLIRRFARGISYRPAALKASPPPWIKHFYDSRIISTLCTKPRQRYIFYEGSTNLGTKVALKTYIPPWLRESSMWWVYQDTHSVYVTSRTIHGDHYLPLGYSLAFVPRNAKVESLTGFEEPNLGSSYNFPKLAVALFQTIYASFTLFQSRGDQIGRYGYAAFGLTVLPYAVMSCVNLIGNMITPDYPELYMVQSEVMLEAEKYGARFQGVVGKLVCSPGVVTQQQRGTFRTTSCAGREGATNGPDMTSSEEDGLATITSGAALRVRREGTTGVLVPVMDSSGEGGLKFTTGETILRVRRERHFWDDKSEDDLKVFLHWRRRVGVKPLPNLWIPACPPFERSDSSAIHAGHTLFMGLLGVPSRIARTVVTLINGIILGTLAWLTGGFNAGGSTRAQRVWIMMWLAFGFFIGRAVAWMPATAVPATSGRPSRRRSAYILKDLESRLAPLMISITYCAPAVGGLVVVGRMLSDYGSCQYFG